MKYSPSSIERKTDPSSLTTFPASVGSSHMTRLIGDEPHKQLSSGHSAYIYHSHPIACERRSRFHPVPVPWMKGLALVPRVKTTKKIIPVYCPSMKDWYPLLSCFTSYILGFYFLLFCLPRARSLFSSSAGLIRPQLPRGEPSGEGFILVGEGHSLTADC